MQAGARGLLNLRTTLDALPQLVTDEALELFAKYGVFSPRESRSRHEIALEHHALSVGVEVDRSLLDEVGVPLPSRPSTRCCRP